MRSISIQADFESWRDAARQLLHAEVKPDDVLWCENTDHTCLFAEEVAIPATVEKLRVPAAFLDLARTASAHTDSRRWALLYRVLWRLTRGNERQLLIQATDPDVRTVQNWCKAVGRDIHKMHAFVRFRFVGHGEVNGREQYLAWFEPSYRIVRLAVPFFVRRFAAMDWSILTPDECVHWDGNGLQFSPGLPRDAAPNADALDELWRTYYRSIFNPARLKVRAMQAEMPKKYLKNLPEAAIIEELIASSHERVEAMLETEGLPAKPTPKNAYLESLRKMNDMTPD